MICKKSLKRRRRILNNIPEGMYCYDSEKTCKYWKVLKYNKNHVVRAKCKLYNIKDKYDQDLILLWDQCKICDLKLGLRNDEINIP